MKTYLTGSRRLDLVLCALFAIVIALTSLRLPVYHNIDPQLILPKPVQAVDEPAADSGEQP